MWTAERLLVLSLRLSAIVTLLAFPCVLLPVSWMDWTHRFLGLGPIPPGPVFVYLARTISFLYGAHGALALALSFDVRRHLPIIRVVSVLMLVFGIALTVIDLEAGLPWWWVAGEGPGLIAYYCVTTWLAFRVSERPSG